MPRPSQNIDQRLLQSGLALLPQSGARALSIRQVADHAGVNLGMFHYHFKTKDVFVRAVLQEMYEGMFARLTVEAHHADTPIENLRGALLVLAQFARDHGAVIARMLSDALAGETIIIEFLKANVPRHISVIGALIAQAQREGAIRNIPLTQAVAFLAGAVGAPILLGGAAASHGALPMAMKKRVAKDVFSDAAIAERIEMALIGLSIPPAASTPKRTPIRRAKK